MKRSSGDKPEVIEISDDESPQQPPQKIVKKEAEHFSAQSILAMHQHVVKLEKDYQEACRLADESQKRVAFLENLLDKKQEASEDAEKEELKKKLTEVSGRLEEVTRKEGETRKKDYEKSQENVKLKFDIVGLKKTIASMHTDQQLLDRATLMTAQLTDQLHKANENTKKDLERIAELNQKLAQFDGTTQEKLQIQLQSQSKLVEELQKRIDELNRKLADVIENDHEKQQSQSNLVEDLQKKIAETSAELEKEKNEAANREEQQKRLAKLEKDYQGVCRIANEYEMGMNEAKERVHVLENIIDKKPIIAPVVVDEREKNLVAELQTKLAETSTQLENERRDACNRELQLHDSVLSLTQRLEAEQARARDERKNNRELRIEQNRLYKGNKMVGSLSTTTTRSFDAMDPPLDVMLMSSTKKPTMARPTLLPPSSGPPLLPMFAAMQTPVQLGPLPKRPPTISGIYQATSNIPDIFEFGEARAPDSIPFPEALKRLQASYYASSKEWMSKCKIALANQNLRCASCCAENRKTLHVGMGIFVHFFSKKHVNKMQSSTLPLATLEHWLTKLQAIPRTAAAPRIRAASVSPKVEGALKPAKAESTMTTTTPPPEKAATIAVAPKMTASDAVPAPVTVASEAGANRLRGGTSASAVAAVTVSSKLASVVFPTVPYETPATKVATVAPTVSAPVLAPLRPVKKEEVDTDGKRESCSVM